MPRTEREHDSSGDPADSAKARRWYGSVPLGVSADDIGAELRASLAAHDPAPSRSWLTSRLLLIVLTAAALAVLVAAGLRVATSS